MQTGDVRSRTVLVTGAAGGMGLRLVSRLVESGWKVRGLVLPNDPQHRRLEWLGCEVIEGDVRDPTSLAGACDGVDTVYHLAAVILSNDPSVFRAVNRDGTANVVAAAARARVKHFVYVSSASVVYPDPTPYSQSKRDAEAIVSSERAFAHTIVRPTLVYDESGGLELSMFERYLMRFPIVPFIGNGAALKRPVLSDDIVDGLVRLAGNEVAFGKIYNLSGSDTISIGDFARLILEHRGVKRRFLHVPVLFCQAVARLLHLTMKEPPFTLSAIAGLTQDADLDPSSAMRDLGYRPIGVREGFRRCFPLQSRAATADRYHRTRSQDDAAPNP